MKMRRFHQGEAVNAGSMADIAFLLLIFFLATTTILQEKGLAISLPPHSEKQDVMPMNDRNVFTVSVNSKNQFLIQDQPRDNLAGLRQEVKEFVLNYGRRPELSENPEKAVVSLKTYRGTQYSSFISALDEIKAAYYEIYGERSGITPDIYRSLDLDNPRERALYEKGKRGIPMNISIAEPN